MIRFFVNRHRPNGTGIYILKEGSPPRYALVSSIAEYHPDNFGRYAWYNACEGDVNMLQNQEHYIEVPEDLLHVLGTPEYLLLSSPYTDRFDIPAFAEAKLRFRRPPVKGSNTKHKIGVPKNKLP